MRKVLSAAILGSLLVALIVISSIQAGEELWTVGFAVSTDDTVLFATQASYTLTEEGFKSAGDFAISRGPAYIKMTEPLPRHLLLSNETPQEQEFLLLEFIDTTAVEFALDENTRKFHRLRLAAGEAKDFTTELPLVEEGLHNLFLVCLYRLRGPGGEPELATHLRAYVESLFVGKGLPPQYTAARPADFLEGRRSNRLRKVLPKGGLLISLEKFPEEGDFLTELEASSGEEVQFYIHMRNKQTGRPVTEFAVVAVLDGEQIPVDGEALAVSLRLGPGAEIAIPAKLKAPEEKGEHELWLLAFEEPYIRKGILAGPGLRYSLRVKLMVN